MSTEKENKTDNDDEVCEIIDIKIVPYRFLKPQTSEKVLNKIDSKYRKSKNYKFMKHNVCI